MTICYDRAGNAVQIGDEVLAADKGCVRRVRVEGITNGTGQGFRLKATLKITWLENEKCGTWSYSHAWQNRSGNLKLNTVTREPDGLLRMYRIIKV